MPEVSIDPASPVRSRTFATLLENADYRRFYLGQGVSLIGTWLQDAAVSWIVFAMVPSEWTLGLVSAAGTMPGLVVGLYAGALADRLPPKMMILAMQAAQMLMAFLLAALVWAGVAQIWQMALILAITRVCVTFEMPSRQVFLYDLVGKRSLMNAIALNSGLFNASKVVGPALAAVILAKFGRTSCFAINGVSYLAAIAALLTIRRSHRPRPRDHEETHWLSGLHHLADDRHLASLFAVMTFFGVVGMGYAALVPAYARRSVMVGEYGYGTLLAASGVGATLGALALATVSGYGRKDRLALGGLALFGASLAVAGMMPPILLSRGMRVSALVSATAGMFGAGFGALAFYASIQTMIQTTVPDALRGRIMGVWMIAFSGSVPLGSLAAGALAARFGVSSVMTLSAAACVAVAVAAGLSGWLRGPEPLPMTAKIDFISSAEGS